MANITKRKPGDSKIPSRDWNNIAEFASQGLGTRPPPLNSLFGSTVLVRNDTGADLDRFDCISLGEPLFALQSDGSVDLIFAGELADPAKPAAILTEPIAHDATNKRFGRVWIYGLAFAFVGPAASVSDLTAAPTPTNNRLAPGSGTVRLLAAPSTTEEKLLPVLLGAASGGGEIHYLFTLTGSISGGAGLATIRNMADTTELATGVSVKDPIGHFDGKTAGNRGICFKSGSDYYALGPYVTSVTWDGTDLTYEAGTDSTLIDTPEEC